MLRCERGRLDESRGTHFMMFYSIGWERTSLYADVGRRDKW